MLVLSQYVEPLYARDLLASGEGAVGYLLKDRVADVDEFVAAVRRVAAGGTVLDPEVVAGLVSGSASRPLDRLTDREREVLTLMAEGRSNAAIAARLFVSEKAVGKHTNAIFTKLDLPQAHRRQPSGACRPRVAPGPVSFRRVTCQRGLKGDLTTLRRHSTGNDDGPGNPRFPRPPSLSP